MEAPKSRVSPPGLGGSLWRRAKKAERQKQDNLPHSEGGAFSPPQVDSQLLQQWLDHVRANEARGQAQDDRTRCDLTGGPNASNAGDGESSTADLLSAWAAAAQRERRPSDNVFDVVVAEASDSTAPPRQASPRRAPPPQQPGPLPPPALPQPSEPLSAAATDPRVADQTQPPAPGTARSRTSWPWRTAGAMWRTALGSAGRYGGRRRSPSAAAGDAGGSLPQARLAKRADSGTAPPARRRRGILSQYI